MGRRLCTYIAIDSKTRVDTYAVLCFMRRQITEWAVDRNSRAVDGYGRRWTPKLWSTERPANRCQWAAQPPEK